MEGLRRAHTAALGLAGVSFSPWVTRKLLQGAERAALPRKGNDQHSQTQGWFPLPLSLWEFPSSPVGIPGSLRTRNTLSLQNQPPPATLTLSARPEGTRSHVLPLDVGLTCDTSGPFLLPNTQHGSHTDLQDPRPCPTPALPPHSALHAQAAKKGTQ